MKPLHLLMLAFLASAALVAPDASAHGGGAGFRPVRPGVVHRAPPVVRVHPGPVIVHRPAYYPWAPAFGAWWYGWPPPPSYYGPSVVAVPVTPPVYVEQADEAPNAPVAGYWYWCADPAGYHPEVSDCPGGWQPVPPRSE